MTAADLAAAALAELTRRRAVAADKVALGRGDMRRAEQSVRLWAGIAAWFGAELPRDLRPVECWQMWTDHGPRAASAAQWLHQIAAELRRAALHQLVHSEQTGTPAGQTRARTLLALDSTLGLAAGLPPIGAAEPKGTAA